MLGTRGWEPFVAGAGLTMLAAVPLWLARHAVPTITPASASAMAGYFFKAPSATYAVLAYGAIEMAAASFLTIYGVRQGATEASATLLITAWGIGNFLLQFGIGWIRITSYNVCYTKYYEADQSIAQNYGGTGLGLSICLSLTHLMGGEISVQSQRDLGSKFIVRIPLMRAKEEPKHHLKELADLSEAPNKPTGKPVLLNVLLADDHPTNQRVVEAMLKAFDCNVVCAKNGQEAFEKAQLGHFDLILMDMAMPVMDGLEATRKVRAWEAQSERRRTPLSMLTAYTNDQAIEDARRAGADFHIAKPVTPHSLLAGLERAIQAAKSYNFV